MEINFIQFVNLKGNQVTPKMDVVGEFLDLMQYDTLTMLFSEDMCHLALIKSDKVANNVMVSLGKYPSGMGRGVTVAMDVNFLKQIVGFNSMDVLSFNDTNATLMKEFPQTERRWRLVAVVLKSTHLFIEEKEIPQSTLDKYSAIPDNRKTCVILG